MTDNHLSPTPGDLVGMGLAPDGSEWTISKAWDEIARLRAALEAQHTEATDEHR